MKISSWFWDYAACSAGGSSGFSEASACNTPAADQLQQLVLVSHGDIVVAICADGEIGVANPLGKGKMGVRFSVIGAPFRSTQKAMQPMKNGASPFLSVQFSVSNWGFAFKLCVHPLLTLLHAFISFMDSSLFQCLLTFLFFRRKLDGLHGNVKLPDEIQIHFNLAGALAVLVLTVSWTMTFSTN